MVVTSSSLKYPYVVAEQNFSVRSWCPLTPGVVFKDREVEKFGGFWPHDANLRSCVEEFCEGDPIDQYVGVEW